MYFVGQKTPFLAKINTQPMPRLSDHLLGISRFIGKVVCVSVFPNLPVENSLEDVPKLIGNVPFCWEMRSDENVFRLDPHCSCVR